MRLAARRIQPALLGEVRILPQYEKPAADAYDRLTKPLFCGSKDYWKIGNTFDTMTDYLLHSNRQSEGPKLAGQVFDVYDNAKNTSAAWYDDFAWWGIACSKAFDPDYKDIFGADKIQHFQTIAVSDPFNCNLGPFQNTVMNALYLTLALRLQQLLGAGGTEQGKAAELEYGFLRDWIDLTKEFDNALLYPFGNGSLVRERVATYAALNGKFPPVNGYDKNATWLGDQGLMLAAMAEYHNLHPTAGALDLADKLWRGAFDTFKGRALEPTLNWSVGDNREGEDYDFGRGVFWRSVFHAFNRSQPMALKIRTSIREERDNFVYRSAEEACNTQLPEKVANGDENKALCLAFNVLATLTAADAIRVWMG